MANYSTWKVNDLKAELKQRGIPQTGLRVKQNFIDRLLEDDAKKPPGDAPEPSEQPEAPGEEQPERDEHAQREPAAPSESLEPKPDQKELHEQKHDAQPEAQRDADAKNLDEAETMEGVQEQPEQQEQQVQRTDDQVAQQEQQAETAGEPEPQAAAEAAAPQVRAEQPPAEPVEQAPGDSTAQEPTPAAPDAADSVAPAEKAAPPAPSASEVHTELSTPVPTEEALEDSRKRKRRSKSPAPTPHAISNKRARSRSGSPRVVLPEDTGAGGPALKKDEPAEEHAHRPSAPEESRSRKGAPLKQDARFRELITPAEREPVRPPSPRDVAMEDAEVEPALHDATAALYVDGLMRPLQPIALKNHLISIASAPGASPNRNVVKEFYLDPIKTHCFVAFDNVSAASRARSALHGTVWPNERNRKSLFVDFIPEQKMQEWINAEEGSRGRSGPAPRWAVKYDQKEGGVEAVHEELDTKAAPPQAPREPAASRAPPLGPRADLPDNDRRPSGPPAGDSHPQPGQGFQPLDELFMSTTAKPKVYYKPVPREVADRRLDRFDDLIHKGSYPRRGGDETRRVSFEDGDFFVDQGPEFLNRGRRGGRGRGRGFGLREGRRSRY